MSNEVAFESFVDRRVYVKGFGALGFGQKRVKVDEFTKVDIDNSLGKVVILSGGTDYQAALTGMTLKCINIYPYTLMY